MSDAATLASRIDEVAAGQTQDGLAVALFDYETRLEWSRHGERWFHAASTIKVAVLLALFDAVAAGRFTPSSRLHVRNRFFSARDGSVYTVAAGRDADREVHRAIGKTMRLDELARHMIVTSSNLATNLLVDLIGIDWARAALARRGIDGVELVRGVEDERAFEASINNRITARGLVALFREIYQHAGLPEDLAVAMLDILCAQEFRSGIPAGVPAEVRACARIANKTGEISSVAHDAGLVFLPNRQPYVLAVLTEPEGAGDGRMERIARVSSAVYDFLT